jgi:hypothetical protein
MDYEPTYCRQECGPFLGSFTMVKLLCSVSLIAAVQGMCGRTRLCGCRGSVGRVCGRDQIVPQVRNNMQWRSVRPLPSLQCSFFNHRCACQRAPQQISYLLARADRLLGSCSIIQEPCFFRDRQRRSASSWILHEEVTHLRRTSPRSSLPLLCSYLAGSHNGSVELRRRPRGGGKTGIVSIAGSRIKSEHTSGPVGWSTHLV